MSRRSRRITAVTGVGLLTAALAPALTAQAAPAAHARHVLVLSVDGMHQADLARYVATHPGSPLALLVRQGTEYTGAQTTNPSDSFPGLVAQFTGGTPAASGVFYDDTWNPTLLPAGTVDCATASPGAEVSFTEAADRSQDPITLDAGQGLTAPALTALPHNTLAQTLATAPAITRAILAMTPTPQALLDPAALPVDPATCLPIYPHSYLRVNTVFEVARAHGLRTAWSDKHAVYEILSGPSGAGVQDLFTPEINSVADVDGLDWTNDNLLTREYDGTKVAAVLNEIAGKDHSGTPGVGTPAIFGMNFQSVSTAQKLPTSDGLAGGYLPGGAPGPLLSGALAYVDQQVGRIQAALRASRQAGSTTIVLSSKHGQSPVDRSSLRRVDDGAVLDGLDAAWAAQHPGAAPLVSFSVDDDAMLLWLSDHSASALSFAKAYLLGHPAPANVDGDPTGTSSATVASSGLNAVHVGAGADAYLGAGAGDPRVPDLVGQAQHGVVYTGKTGKISEHGGASAEDRDVPLVVSGGGVPARVVDRTPVQTTQIAPSILQLLGLDPDALQAVQREHTAVLPVL